MTRIDLEPIDIILLDIEGTTTPIDFVYKTLFPYVRSHLVEFLNQGVDADDLAQIEAEYKQETDDTKPPWNLPPTDYLLWLMDQDRKSPGLKSIQGKIWEQGYRQGVLQGVLFEDVFPAIQSWSQRGVRIFIYSSGSVLAQKLLFSKSSAGDLSPWISGYFDTKVGSKREADSYRAIAQQISIAPERCLFISDIVPECEAANRAGFQVRQAVRPGNNPQKSSFATISSFRDIELGFS